MYRIEMEKECSCFKKSNFGNDLTFENKEDAIMRAKVLECRMNQEFCLCSSTSSMMYWPYWFFRVSWASAANSSRVI